MSISLDFSVLWPTINMIVNNFWIILAIPLGFVFGFAILSKVIKEIKGSFGGF